MLPGAMLPACEGRSQRFASQIACRFGGRRRFPSNSSGIRRGGAYRDRTGDPLLAKQVLSQLS